MSESCDTLQLVDPKDRDLRLCATKILNCHRLAINSLKTSVIFRIQTGAWLIKARELAGPRKFDPWLRKIGVPISRKTVTNYMDLAERFIGHLGNVTKMIAPAKGHKEVEQPEPQDAYDRIVAYQPPDPRDVKLKLETDPIVKKLRGLSDSANERQFLEEAGLLRPRKSKSAEILSKCPDPIGTNSPRNFAALATMSFEAFKEAAANLAANVPHLSGDQQLEVIKLCQATILQIHGRSGQKPAADNSPVTSKAE